MFVSWAQQTNTHESKRREEQSNADGTSMTARLDGTAQEELGGLVCCSQKVKYCTCSIWFLNGKAHRLYSVMMDYVVYNIKLKVTNIDTYVDMGPFD